MIKPSLLKSVAAVLTLVSFTQCEESKDNEVKKEAADEVKWEVLFDGKDLSNFRNYKKEDVHKKWVVKDGAFTITAKGGGDLITKKQYSAFELKLDYKVLKSGNSGIMYHVAETQKKPWHTGPEVQIQDNVDGYDPEKSGWLYGLYSATIDATNPVGEWNTLRIVVTPEKCEHFMNGKKYCEYVKGSEDWDKKVALTKFAEFPSFGKETKGHISFQDHGDVVSFRNVMIKDLSQK